jgi:tetratricopeptide (TPR) repeat protein
MQRHSKTKKLINTVVVVAALFFVSWAAIAVFSFLYMDMRIKYYKIKNEVIFLEKNIGELRSRVNILSKEETARGSKVMGFLNWQLVLKDQVDNANVRLKEKIRAAGKDKALLDLLYYSLGLNYTTAVDFPRAIEAFEEALQNDPKDADACYNLGLLYSVYRQDKKTADKYYRRYVELAPAGPKTEEVKRRLGEPGK